MTDARKWIRSIRRETPPDLWHDVTTRAQSGRRPEEPERRPLRTALVLVVSLAVVGSALYALRDLGGEETAAVSPSPSSIDPTAVCALPAYDPTVTLLVGNETVQYPISVLEGPGAPAALIDHVAGDALRGYLASPAAVHAPGDGWRAIASDPDAVTFAAPYDGARPEWWIVAFDRQPDGTWKRVQEEIVQQQETPAQRGHGLDLRWTGDLVLEGGAWNDPLALVNGRAAVWTDPNDGFVAVPHVFDASGREVVAGAPVPPWHDGSHLEPGAQLPVPVALGATLADLQPGTYRVVTCEPDLALASAGTLVVQGTGSVPGVRVLTYPFGGTSMTALFGGTLRIQNGCLAMGDAQRSIYVLWPQGYAWVERDGRQVLIDQIGHEVAAIGDQVSLEGGFVTLDPAENLVIGGVPDACRTGGEGYFVTSGPA